MNTLQFVNSKPASAVTGRKGRGREREGGKGKELENQRKCLKSHIDGCTGLSLENFVRVPAQSVRALRCLHFFSQAYSESRLPAEMIPIKLKGLPKGLPIHFL